MVFTLTIPDRIGIIATMAQLLSDQQANISDLQQHVEEGILYSRWQVDTDHLNPVPLQAAFPEAALLFHQPKINVLILCSSQRHCSDDLYWRFNHQEIASRTVLRASNTEQSDMQHVQDEQDILRLVEHNDIQLVVLARYMKILSPQLLDVFTENNVHCINIHHSFLPAFSGAKAYHQAWARGVKALGATAHYVTEELDAGPIIAQSVDEINHHHSPEQLVIVGRDLEKIALARAVRAHVEGRVLRASYDGIERCIVFD